VTGKVTLDLRGPKPGPDECGDGASAERNAEAASAKAHAGSAKLCNIVPSRSERHRLSRVRTSRSNAALRPSCQVQQRRNGQCAKLHRQRAQPAGPDMFDGRGHASGQATAAPPSRVMNSRRLMSDLGACSPTLCQRRTPEGQALRGRVAAHLAYHGRPARSLDISGTM
jgi:hypothetical protein